ncbi:hypothetical protein [Luteolibacter sp. AS25]|uniref:hypothetical protein n=1 Tax=Luteolibacter sp. AS25 TaxID=3135776 RepID=UPI00398B5500
MKKLFKYLFLIFGCLHLTGGPYALVQSYAWATMLVEYSQESSLAEAAVDTFSGEKPCSLCIRIEASKQDDSKQDPVLPTLEKLSKELLPISLASLKEPVSQEALFASFSAPAELLVSYQSGPPSPPPRA